MKGILLAGGSGTRLRPLTNGLNKHLLPVFDKPMVFYPLATLMQAGIRDILLITHPADKPVFEALLGPGAGLGLKISYAVQEKPNGIAEAFLIGEKFIDGEPCALILGDNIFHGGDFTELVSHAAKRKSGASVFAREVHDPQRFGVVEFDGHGRARRLVEKPKDPRSNWAVTGLYLYDNQVTGIAKTLKPSARGELEITDVNKAYLEKDALNVECLDPTTAWLDTGTPEALLEAANFIQKTEQNEGRKIACLEEIAWRSGFITLDQMMAAGAGYAKTAYGEYLATLYETECAKNEKAELRVAS
ncbi:MAG: glucose-1-phosphate thymidylyltransferase RfbA [Proteobacteria bacterium]|nr:glucose-1-phosphate thymidylyltransferase RfbA [Pseudomonadota bacterium]